MHIKKIRDNLVLIISKPELIPEFYRQRLATVISTLLAVVVKSVDSFDQLSNNNKRRLLAFIASHLSVIQAFINNETSDCWHEFKCNYKQLIKLIHEQYAATDEMISNQDVESKSLITEHATTIVRQDNRADEEQLFATQQQLTSSRYFETLLTATWCYAISHQHRAKQIFISYAWPSTEANAWNSQFVESLVNHLRAAGMQVFFDRNDSGAGFPLHEFMKRINQVDHVLVISTPTMQDKLANGDSGVSQEHQIIKNIVSSDPNKLRQRFVIPILLNHRKYCHQEWQKLAEVGMCTHGYLDCMRDLFQQIYQIDPVVFRDWWQRQLYQTGLKQTTLTKLTRGSLLAVAAVASYCFAIDFYQFTQFRNKIHVWKQHQLNPEINPQLENELSQRPYYIEPFASLSEQDHTNSFALYKYLRKELSNTTSDKYVQLIQGGPGFGKTLFMQRLHRLLWEELTFSNLLLDYFLPDKNKLIALIMDGAEQDIRSNLVATLVTKANVLAKADLTMLLQRYRLLIIFDAFDQHILDYNLFNTNNLTTYDGRVKMLYTSRARPLQQLGQYHQLFIPVNELTQKFNPRLYQELHLSIFSDNQIRAYLKKMHGSVFESYWAVLNRSPGLLELIRTPLLLRMVSQLLPKQFDGQTAEIAPSGYTQYEIYHEFLRGYFEIQAQKIMVATTDNAEQILTDIKLFWEYCQRLSSYMLAHGEQIEQEQYKLLNQKYSSQALLLDHGSPLSIHASYKLKICCATLVDCPTPPPHSQHGNTVYLTYMKQGRNYNWHYAGMGADGAWQDIYMHSDYLRPVALQTKIQQFFEKKSCEQVVNNHNYQHELLSKILDVLQITNTHSIQFAHITYLDFFTTRGVLLDAQQYQGSLQTITNSTINTKLLVANTVANQFILDLLRQDSLKKTLVSYLLECIDSSRQYPTAIAAANAISLLTRARINLSEKNFSYVQIPQADISEGIFHYTNFSNANLSKVTAVASNFRGTDFTDADLRQIKLGELPSIDLTNNTRAAVFSADQRYFAFIDGCCAIALYNATSYQRLGQIASPTRHSFTQLDFNFDGQLLATLSASRLTFWMLDLPHVYHVPLEIDCLKPSCSDIAFHPSENILAIAFQNGTIVLYDISIQSTIIAFQFSENFKQVNLKDPNIQQGFLAGKLGSSDLLSDFVTSIKFDVSGRYLGISDNCFTIYLCLTAASVEDQRRCRMVVKYNTNTFDYVFYKNAAGQIQLLISGPDGKLQVYDLSTFTLTDTQLSFSDATSSVAFYPSPNNKGGKIAIVNWDKRIKLLDAVTFQVESYWYSSCAMHVLFHPNGREIVNFQGYQYGCHYLERWDISNLKRRYINYDEFYHSVTGVAYHSNQLIISTQNSLKLRLYNLTVSIERAARVINLSTCGISTDSQITKYELSHSGNELLVQSTNFEEVYLYKLKDNACVRIHRAVECHTLLTMSLHPKLNIVAVGDNAVVLIFVNFYSAPIAILGVKQSDDDLSEGLCWNHKTTAAAKRQRIAALSFDRFGQQLLAGTLGGKLFIWNSQPQAPSNWNSSVIELWPGISEMRLENLLLHPNDSNIVVIKASQGDSTQTRHLLYVYDLNLRSIKSLLSSELSVGPCAFNTDGSLLVATLAKQFYLFDGYTLSQLHTVNWQLWLTGVQFISQNKFILSDAGGGLSVWRVSHASNHPSLILESYTHSVLPPMIFENVIFSNNTLLSIDTQSLLTQKGFINWGSDVPKDSAAIESPENTLIQIGEPAIIIDDSDHIFDLLNKKNRILESNLQLLERANPRVITKIAPNLYLETWFERPCRYPDGTNNIKSGIITINAINETYEPSTLAAMGRAVMQPLPICELKKGELSPDFKKILLVMNAYVAKQSPATAPDSMHHSQVLMKTCILIILLKVSMRLPQVFRSRLNLTATQSYLLSTVFSSLIMLATLYTQDLKIFSSLSLLVVFRIVSHCVAYLQFPSSTKTTIPIIATAGMLLVPTDDTLLVKTLQFVCPYLCDVLITTGFDMMQPPDNPVIHQPVISNNPNNFCYHQSRVTNAQGAAQTAVTNFNFHGSPGGKL